MTSKRKNASSYTFKAENLYDPSVGRILRSQAKKRTNNDDSSMKKIKSTDGPFIKTKKRKTTNKFNRVFVFGNGEDGQLGLGEKITELKVPTKVTALDDENIVDVACGGMHSVALTKDGKLWSWGSNDNYALGRSGEERIPGRVENMDDVYVVKVVCSDSSTMALSKNGELYCWGMYYSSGGPLGFSTAKKVQKLPTIFEPFLKLPITDIAAGVDHCLALTKDKRVFVWGNGEQYQLGRRVLERHIANSLRPEAVPLRNIKLIGCGNYHSFAVSENNTLYAWGLNNYEQCGIVDKSNILMIKKPRVVTAMNDKGTIKSIKGGQHHSLILMEDGIVYSFGRAEGGQLGLPAELIEQVQTETTSSFKSVSIPTQIPELENIVDIDTYNIHSIALDTSGNAYTWGYGEAEALGNGTSNDEETPYNLKDKIKGNEVIRISVGGQHSMILVKERNERKVK